MGCWSDTPQTPIAITGLSRPARRGSSGALGGWPLTLVVSGHPPSLNRIGRSHHLALYREWLRYRESVAWQAKALHVHTPLLRAVVRATLVYERRPFRDSDSAAASLKPCLDGLVVGGLLIDDSTEHLRLEVSQELGKERSVRLQVWPAEHGETASAHQPHLMHASDACGDDAAHADDGRKDETLLHNEQPLCEAPDADGQGTAAGTVSLFSAPSNHGKAFQFLGYHQTEGTDPAEAERCLDMVYERIIQAVLRARARRISGAAQGSHLRAGSHDATEPPVSHKGEIGWGNGKEP